jgi:thioredoxin reductase (NADPH)
MSTSPAKPLLSPEQLERLAKLGEERQAAVGDVLFKAGDRRYPFIVILEGEVVIQDPDGHEVIRHGTSGFLGEISLLSGQTAYLSAVVTEPTRYLAIDREQLRPLLSEDGALSTIILTAFNARREMLQARVGLGLQIIGPRSSSVTRAMVDFARRNRLPFTWNDTELAGEEAARALIDGLNDSELPLVRIPAGPDLRNPSPGEVSRTLGIGLELAPREEVDLLIVGGGPAGLGAAVYGASEGLSTLVVECTALGGQAGTSRLIENYLGFPAGISGSELTMRAITQARKFAARSATPYKATALELGKNGDGHVVRLEDDHFVNARAVVLATGADYRRLPVANLEDYEGSSVFYAAGPPEARLCGAQRVAVVGGGNSAAQAAIWLTRGGAVVTLLHRRANLSGTMSDYLIHDLDRYGVAVRDNSEIAELHGRDGRLDAVTLKDGERLPLGFLFLFLGAAPCTEWLRGEVDTDEHGFVLTGPAAGAERFLETNVPGVFAVGDVRSGSVKRCATAVGEGAMAVSFVHEYLSGAVA